MSDPRRPDGYDPNRPYWSQPPEQIPPPDPAYGGYYSYPSYVPSAAHNPTEPLPPYWTQTQYPPTAPPPPPQDSPPGPPKSPRWLWGVAGAAVTLVIGLVIALVIANGSSQDDTAVAPLPPMPDPTTTNPLPTTTRTAAPIPIPIPTASPQTPGPATTATPWPTTTDAAATETVVYTVTGVGRAISITYIDTGGVLQMEFNVVLPWSRQVVMSPTTARAASVTVINVGREISCSITLNGDQAEYRTGSGLTICSSIGR